MSTTIRLLDGKALAPNASVAEQDAFCEALIEGFSKQGMVKLINHGIPDEDIDGIFQWNRKFFQLPDHVKRSVAHPPRANPNRGWVCAGQERSDNITDFEKGVKQRANKDGVFDLKESFDTGAIDDPLYANKWPAESDIPGFRAHMEKFYDMCQDVHIGILRALERGFRGRGVKVDLVERCRENVSEMRLNYYPPIDIPSLRTGRMSRISEHTDFGTVTLLFQDSVGGLEVESQSAPGTYFPVEASSASEILVNIGDSLQRLTNDVLTSVSHRVTVPVSERDREAGVLAPRYSVAYFAKVARGESLKPIEVFVDEERGCPAKYPDLTAWEWNQIKLQKIYG
ncbi:clavaminate synthase-like protein [Diplodia corticola]|uniref:Clavaminate synthase-like protein n=1 Tax=Diplodia corticola TaxID=236234 RepID=A0A1J9RL03_9PEZI|nr:clavaminate synthase-like protein [Diplodia corticola]OJD40650.1 clavaminate synthase-like protein [Diplodia corticola]